MKKHLLKKTKSFFAFLLLILPSLAMTQGNPPPNVINFQSTDTLINSTMVDSVVLYSFFAHKSNINVSLNFSSKSGMDSLYSLSLLDSNQTIIVQAIDSNLNITHSNLLIGKHYFIKIEAALNDTFALLLGDTTIVIYDTNHVCGFADNCNLLTNANFDNVFPSATINNNSNPLFINGFGTAQDTMSLVDSNKNYYSNMVCDWYKILETPVIGNDSLKQNFAGMWGKFDNQECIATRTKIYPGIMYVVEYDLKSDCNSGISGANLRFGFRPSLMPIQVPPSQAASILYYNKAILPGTFSWHHETDTFTLSPLVFGSIPMKEMWIYPQSSSGNYPLNIGIDNIVLKPLSLSPATPIVNGIRFICNQTDSIFTYSITNYDSLWVYFVEVNNGSLPYSKKIFTQNFSLNLGIESVTTINLTVCGKTSSFEVYRCCNPYTATDSALYYCNDTITTNQIIDGNNISICGVLQINANVTIKNSEILFGPESSIKVGSSYTLTLINDSLADGCQRLWKGVYPTDSTSRIIVDSCYFEHSYSALNSYNNSKLQVINSVFENNNLAIHFRAYNLDKPIPDQNGYWYVAPSNAYVVGNTFKFTNSFVSNTQYISNPVGIQIDTVYKITIGDNSSVALVNIFDSLRYGIKGVNSIANIYNASFNQINQFNYQVNLDYSVDNQNVPLEGAIHFSKTKLPANSIPASTQINKAIGNQYLTIGGDSGRTCTFNNCNFGIFAENVSVQIKNNTFTNQKYNAIYIKELFDSHIMNNQITMTGNYTNVDEVLKASIQIRNIQNVSAGRDVWILNNTINNPTADYLKTSFLC